MLGSVHTRKDSVMEYWELAAKYPVTKSCPFCGSGKAIVEQDKCDASLYLVKCRECYAITDRASSPEEAIELWNDEQFPDHILATNKGTPYINDLSVFKDLKNAVVVATFDEYKLQKKLALKNWRDQKKYDYHMCRALQEKYFFESESFTFFSDIPGEKIIDAADKQARYDVFFREKHRCRGCGNNECEHTHYIWWLWDKGNIHDKCIGRKKKGWNKRKENPWTKGRLYRSAPH